MGREIRMVKPGWQHPRQGFGQEFKPLYKGPFSVTRARWQQEKDKWDQGYYLSDFINKIWSPISQIRVGQFQGRPFSDWYGPDPVASDFIPEWLPGEATLMVMYENTSKGKPISPPFQSPQDLAAWLAENRASYFGNSTMDYHDWLEFISGQLSPFSDKPAMDPYSQSSMP